MTKKRETISQQRIARDLGVSQALVSLVLNGKCENISKDSSQKILDHALKIGYRPKGMQLAGGRALATGIGFILRANLQLHTQSNFFSQVQHGLHAGLLDRGYHTVFLGSEDDLGVRAVQQILRKHRLFGVVVLGQVDKEFIQAIKAVQSNLVVISYSYPGLCHSIMPNEKQAIEQLVSHLTDLGHVQFGWLGGNKALDYNHRRYTGVVESLAARGLKLNRKFTVDVETGDRLAGWEAAEIMLSRISARDFPTACICGNGSMARGFLNCLMQCGWSVPGQISVVAIDASGICVEERPQITGAHSDPEAIGMTAAKLLLRSGGETDGVLSDVIMPAQLTIRDTSAKLAA